MRHRSWLHRRTTRLTTLFRPHMMRCIFTDAFISNAAQGPQRLQVSDFSHFDASQPQHHNNAAHPVATHTTQHVYATSQHRSCHDANTLTSRQSLKKYVRANNTINVGEKMFDSLFNKALKNGVDKGVFEQPKGMQPTAFTTCSVCSDNTQVPPAAPSSPRRLLSLLLLSPLPRRRRPLLRRRRRPRRRPRRRSPPLRRLLLRRRPLPRRRPRRRRPLLPRRRRSPPPPRR